MLAIASTELCELVTSRNIIAKLFNIKMKGKGYKSVWELQNWKIVRNVWKMKVWRPIRPLDFVFRVLRPCDPRNADWIVR